MAPNKSPPEASSPSLILTHPTSDERTRIWNENYPSWGRSLTHQAYLARETHMLTVPASQDGGFMTWILTTPAAPGHRPILSSCETYRRRAIVRGRDGIVRDVWGHNIGSVYTFEAFRGQGYASRMMVMIREWLAKQHQESGSAPCSVLFSDIGKVFYARHGWIPRESTYIEINVQDAITNAHTLPILDADVPTLAKVDEALLRREVAAPTAGVRFAYLPTADTLGWHFIRDDFFPRMALSRTPAVRGAIYIPPESPNSRVWAYWTGVYSGGLEDPDKNVLKVNRFVVEDQAISDDELSNAIRGIFGIAQREAREWRLARIELWNPSKRLRRIFAAITELQWTFIVRDEESLGSLNWFEQDDSIDDIEWIANEKFVWC